MDTTQNHAPEWSKKIPKRFLRKYKSLSKRRIRLREKLNKAISKYKAACEDQTVFARLLIEDYGSDHRLELPGLNQSDNEILSTYRNGYRDTIRNEVYGQIDITEDKEDWRASKINLNQVILCGMIAGVRKYSDYLEVYLLPISTLEELESFQNKTHPFFSNGSMGFQQTVRKIRITTVNCPLAKRIAPSKFLVGLGSIVGGTDISILGKCFRVYTTVEKFLKDPRNQLVVSYYKIKLPF